MLEQFFVSAYPIYMAGMGYSAIGGLVIAIGFALIRWRWCVKKFIETGKLDDADDSWFLQENNWWHGARDRANYDYGNHPWVVAADIIVVVGIGAILSLAWPITIITVSVIAYAMIARVKFARKKEFMDRLEGKHAT